MPITYYLSPDFVNFTFFPPPAVAPNLLNALNKGVVQGIDLSGRNTAAPTAAMGDIWGYPAIAAGQQVRVLPTAAFTLAMISDSVNDAGAGTGAQTVQVNYLDSNYLPHVAVYTLNGQNAVTNATSVDGIATGVPITNALRINGMEVITAGTGLANAGNIYACDSTNTYASGVPVTTTKVYDFMLAGENIDDTSAFTIPAGYYGFAVQLTPAIADVTATIKYGRVRMGLTTGSNGIFRNIDFGGITSSTNPETIDPAIFPLLLPMTDIRMQCQVSAATEVNCLNVILIWPTT